MPDIAMCLSDTCPLAEKCYRNALSGTEPNRVWQDYQSFEPEGCRDFWPVKPIAPLAMRATDGDGK